VKRLVLVLTVALLMAIPALASAKGGSGVVTPFYVGPLTMNGSTDLNVRGYAGNPNRVTYCRGAACNNSGVWKTFIYRFPGHGLTEYTFNRSSGGVWFLEQFYTNLQRFRTQLGTKVGMSASQAESREQLRYQGGCVASGLWRTVTTDGQFFGSVVDLGYPPRRVLALQLFGPYPLPC
jgi:hypothetical protein